MSRLAVGDLVAADSRVTCGACAACLSGRGQICEALGFVGEACDGGFAEAVTLPASLLHRHDPALPATVAAMAEPLAVALHAVRRLRPPPGEPVLVLGCGTIGGLCALLLSRLHDGPLLLADLNADKAALVAEVCEGTVIALTAEGIAAALPAERLRYALDATGSVAAIETALSLLSGGGALALVGISHGRLALDPNHLVEREIALLGCHAFGDELPEAIALLPELAPDLTRFATILLDLDAVPDAYERLLRGEGRGLKTIIHVAE